MSRLVSIVNSVLNGKAVISAFNQELLRDCKTSNFVRDGLKLYSPCGWSAVSVLPRMIISSWACSVARLWSCGTDMAVVAVRMMISALHSNI